MGLALWIMPPATELPKLKQIMHTPLNLELAYAPPVFEPHITLGSFPSSTPISALRSSILTLPKPPRITFQTLEAGDHYFRSVYIGIQKTNELEALHGALQERLGIEAKSPRFPHLSLFYIPDEHAADRERIRDAFWKNGTATSTSAGNVAFKIIRSESQEDHNESAVETLEGFDAAEIWIVSCEGPTADWKVLDKVALV